MRWPGSTTLVVSLSLALLGGGLGSCGAPAAHTAASTVRSQPTPPCHDAQLRHRYSGTTAGAGSDFGGIGIWNVSGRPCVLARHLTITPVLPTRIGRALARTMAAGLVLSADAPRPRNPTPLPRHVTEAAIDVSGEYRDGAGPRGLCSRRHEVVPLRWDFRDGAVHFTIRNGAANEPRSTYPDGAHPYSGRQPQPIETCVGNGFYFAYAGRAG